MLTFQNFSKKSINETGLLTRISQFITSKKIAFFISIILIVLIGCGIFIGNIISSNIFKRNLKSAYQVMIDGATQVEAYASLQRKVWKNCIDKNSSSETDKYTKDENGNFYPDFNDALSKFFDDHASVYSDISENKSIATEYILKLMEHPKKFEDDYMALRQFYRTYLYLTDLVIGDTKHSLNTFNETFESALWDYEGALSTAKLILE